MNPLGTCAPAFEPVRYVFSDCFHDMGETGAALCVYHEGQPVVDLWGGYADARGQPWAADTLVHLYSVTKPFAAACLLRLVDLGRVDLDTPVEHYWPEFAQAGKDGTRVRWLLTHQAGLLALREPMEASAIFDRPRVVEALAQEAPWWPPGTVHGEHAYFYGHLDGRDRAPR